MFDQVDSPIRRVRFADGVEDGVQVPVMADYDQKITLLGYDISRVDVPSGGATTITAFWTLSGENLDEDYRLPVDYGSFISLRDPNGNTIYETELRTAERLILIYFFYFLLFLYSLRILLSIDYSHPLHYPGYANHHKF